MLCLIALLFAMPCEMDDTMPDDTRILYDFSDPQASDDWLNIDDGVMGGVSVGNWQISADETAIFSGTVSLENNGGFSSVRTRPVQLDLSAYDGLLLRVRGDGQRYGFNLRDSTWTRISYRHTFTTEANTWQTIRVPFAELVATSFGRDLPDVRPLNAVNVRSLGFIISDKQAGPFRLEIASISLYKHHG